ncbi:MAG TPA: hypothetical protein VLI71_03840 [Gammaproteobacteria bacterium]|nr:hypothetical protein [Gammaproteobacteria bacterium]
MAEDDFHALRLRYRAAHQAAQAASKCVTDEASRKRFEEAYKKLEAARAELRAALGQNAQDAPPATNS